MHAGHRAQNLMENWQPGSMLGGVIFIVLNIKDIQIKMNMTQLC